MRRIVKYVTIVEPLGEFEQFDTLYGTTFDKKIGFLYEVKTGKIYHEGKNLGTMKLQDVRKIARLTTYKPLN